MTATIVDIRRIDKLREEAAAAKRDADTEANKRINKEYGMEASSTSEADRAGAKKQRRCPMGRPRETNGWRGHETNESLAWLDVSTQAHPGVEALVDRHLLPRLLSAPYGRWSVRRRTPGGPNSSFYVACNAKIGDEKEGLLLHRAVLGLVAGDGRHASHLNHNTLDNRLANLEATTLRLNIRHGIRGKRARGYCWDKPTGKWLAQVMVEGRRLSLGRFGDEASAAAAYAAANTIIDAAALAGNPLTQASFRASMGMQGGAA